MTEPHIITYINALENRIKELEADRPQGEWKAKSFHEVYCDNCGFTFDIMKCDFLENMKFCPNCGSKMWKGADDDYERAVEQTEDKHAVCTGCDYYDLPNAFHPCASCVDFSKYKPKIEDEPQTEDGIMPEVKAEVRLDENNKTLWIKTDTIESFDRVITEDGSNWCRIFYEDCGECAHNKPRSNDEPQTERSE